MSSDSLVSKLYIEFVGQRTAGKTTIIHDIVDRILLEPKKSNLSKQNKKIENIFCILPTTFVVYENFLVILHFQIFYTQC